MSLQSDLAFGHQADRIRLARRTGAQVTAIWRKQVKINDLDAMWEVVAPQMVQAVSDGQVVAAKQSAGYLDALDTSYGFTAAPAALNVTAFSNVMGDGREIGPALYGAITNTKTDIAKGLAPISAFERGMSFIATIAQSAINDLGRSADRTLSSGKGYTRYIRVVGGSACSRCAILAGQYSAEDAFQRHVCCMCTTMPIEVGKKAPSGLHDDPKAYFDSLSADAQDKVFTNAGAEAIRQGADVQSVVNARRGAYGIGYSGHSTVPNPVRSRLRPITIGRKADGSLLQVYATTEGTSARGRFGKSVGRYERTTQVRLMPEQILKMANGNNARARELLERYGYMNK